jgi:hypothetical protein
VIGTPPPSTLHLSKGKSSTDAEEHEAIHVANERLQQEVSEPLPYPCAVFCSSQFLAVFQNGPGNRDEKTDIVGQSSRNGIGSMEPTR